MSLPSSKISPQGNYPQLPNKTFISTKAFNGSIFTYSTRLNANFVTEGVLVAHPSFTVANSQAGRVLHANGRRLIPEVNPGVTTFLLGVLDPVTGLNGFIDPSSNVFAAYDANLPVQYNEGTSFVPATGGKGAHLSSGPQIPDPVVVGTLSIPNPIINANVTITVTSGTLKIGSLITAVGLANASYITAFVSGILGGTGVYTLSANPTSGAGTSTPFIASNLTYNAVGVNLLAGSATCGKIPSNGTASIRVFTDACTANSLVIGTQWYGTNTSFQMNPSDGYFDLQASTAGTGFSFVIIN
jgi:hypothetical protein